MADGNGSLSDQQDNRSLDAADAAGYPDPLDRPAFFYPWLQSPV